MLIRHVNTTCQKAFNRMNVLVKQNGNAFILHATPQGINGQIGKRQILHYTPHQPFIIDMPMKGSKLTFNQIFVTLK